MRFLSCGNRSEDGIFFFFEMRKQRDCAARLSFRTLIPCKKPKSNRNIKC
jgi:hypothetical protein